MNRLFKITLIVALTLVVLVIGGAVAIITVVDPNDYKNEIAQSVHEATGKTVAFEGDISLSLFPWVGVDIGTMHIANEQEFGGGNMFSVAEASVRMKVIPLLSNKIEVSALTLDGLTINLVRNQNGKANWVLKESETAHSQTDTSSDQQKEKSGTHIPFDDFNVESVQITNAQVLYTDKVANKQFSLNDFNLTTTRISLGSPVNITLSGATKTNAPDISSTFSLSTKATLSETLASLRISEMLLQATATGKDIPGGKVSIEQRADFTLAIPEQKLNLDTLTLKAYDTVLEAKGVLAIAPTPQFSGDISASSNIKKALALLGTTISTADPEVLKTLRASISMTASPEAINASSIHIVMDDTTIHGKAKATSFHKPDITFDLKADTLNLDRYLPQESQTEPKDSNSTPSTSKEPEPSDEWNGIPKEVKTQLRSLVLDGRFGVGTLQAKGITVTNVRTYATAKDGLIKLQELSADIFGGTYKSSALLDVRKELTGTALSITAQSLNLADALLATTGQKHAAGTTSISTELSSAGETLNSIKKTLDGKGNITITNGAIYGFQIIPEAAKKQLKGKNAAKADEATKRQTFDTITASYTVNKGRFLNPDMFFNSPNLKVKGSGFADLASEKINYKAVADITGLPKLPLAITGTFSRPSYSFDAGAFLENTINTLIPDILGGTNSKKSKEETKGDSQKKPENPLEQLGKGLLQNLF